MAARKWCRKRVSAIWAQGLKCCLCSGARPSPWSPPPPPPPSQTLLACTLHCHQGKRAASSGSQRHSETVGSSGADQAEANFHSYMGVWTSSCYCVLRQLSGDILGETVPSTCALWSLLGSSPMAASTFTCSAAWAVHPTVSELVGLFILNMFSIFR